MLTSRMLGRSTTGRGFAAASPRDGSGGGGGGYDAPVPRPGGWAPTPSTRSSTPSVSSRVAPTPGSRMASTPSSVGSGRSASTPRSGVSQSPEKTSAVKVAVRVRPFSSMERQDGCRSIVRMQNQSTFLIDPAGRGEPDEDLYTREFVYDYSYWSFDKAAPNYANQDSIFQDLGMFVLENAFKG